MLLQSSAIGQEEKQRLKLSMAKNSRAGSVVSDIISEKAGKNGSQNRNGSDGEFMLVNYMTDNFQQMAFASKKGSFVQ